MRNYITAHIEETQRAMSAMLADEALLARVEAAAEACIDAMKRRNNVLLVGNGGSAAGSQHLAGELMSRFLYDRPAQSGVALNADPAILTAISNDYGYDRRLARPLEGLARAGDVLLALSTSGQSTNSLTAFSSARNHVIRTIGLTGRDGGKMPPLCDIELRVPFHSTPQIQEIHLLLGHLLCEGIKARMFPRPGAGR
jgi:D-sedoheptulose 7-phosphate isomerase